MFLTQNYKFRQWQDKTIQSNNSKIVSNAPCRDSNFGIVEVAGGVASGFFLEVALDGIGEVDACLVGKASNHPDYVGEFVTEILAGITGFLRLFAVAPRHYACHRTRYYMVLRYAQKRLCD